eukprot:2506075-Prymnesium_polylepis.4
MWVQCSPAPVPPPPPPPVNAATSDSINQRVTPPVCTCTSPDICENRASVLPGSPLHAKNRH